MKYFDKAESLKFVNKLNNNKESKSKSKNRINDNFVKIENIYLNNKNIIDYENNIINDFILSKKNNYKIYIKI